MAIVEAVGNAVGRARLLRVDALVLFRVARETDDARFDFKHNVGTVFIHAQEIDRGGGAAREVGHRHLRTHNAPLSRAHVGDTCLFRKKGGQSMYKVKKNINQEAFSQADLCSGAQARVGVCGVARELCVDLEPSCNCALSPRCAFTAHRGCGLCKRLVQRARDSTETCSFVVKATHGARRGRPFNYIFFCLSNHPEPRFEYRGAAQRSKAPAVCARAVAGPVPGDTGARRNQLRSTFGGY